MTNRRISTQTEVAALSQTLVEECLELSDTASMLILAWRRKNSPTRKGSSTGDLASTEIQHCQLEVALFHLAVLIHLVSVLSPLPDYVRQQLLDDALQLFLRWASRSFPQRIDLFARVTQCFGEYDRTTVVSAIVGANTEAQERLCRTLFSNAEFNAGKSNLWSFRIEFCCRAQPRSAIRILDAIQSKLGPRSPRRSIYEVDFHTRTAALGPVPPVGIREPDPPPLPSILSSKLRARRHLERLMIGASSILAVGSIAALTVAVIGLADSVSDPDINRFAVSLLAVPPTAWLARWSLRNRATSLAALSVLRSGRYVLHLRQSTIDAFPPSIVFEDALAAALAPIAPLVGVGRRSFLHPSGVVYIGYLRNWESGLVELIRGAELSLLVVGPRRGYDQGWGNVDQAWKEIEAITHLATPGRVVFHFPRRTGDLPLLLLHPKGDRVYGVSTLLYEVRRLIDPQLTGEWPDHMGRDSWLWWTTEGRFLPLPTIPGKAVAGGSERQERPDFTPLLKAFSRVPGKRRRVRALVVAGIVTGSTVVFFGNSFLLEVAGQRDLFIVAASAALMALVDFLHSLARRLRWLSYNNTIRPRPTHPFGLQGIPEGRTHDNLPY